MTGERVLLEQVKVVAFLRLGLLDRVEVHGGYRYRLSPKAGTQPLEPVAREWHDPARAKTVSVGSPSKN